jgi:hypothetical protein
MQTQRSQMNSRPARKIPRKTFLFAQTSEAERLRRRRRFREHHWMLQIALEM